MKLNILVFTALWATCAAVPLDSNDLDAWGIFYDNNGGVSWSTCTGTKLDPSSCSFVTVTGDRITGIEIPANEYTGAELTLDADEIHAFTAIETFTVSETNSFTYSSSDSCLKFDGANEDNCGFLDTDNDGTYPYGFCCFQSSLANVWDTLGGSSWRKCTGRRTTLCNCNPSNEGDRIQVVCNKGVAKSLSLRGNSLSYNGDAATFNEMLEDLYENGANSFKFQGDSNNIVFTDVCPYLPVCDYEDVTCQFKGDLTICGTPTASPVTRTPTMSPVTSSPTLSPISCEDVNNYEQRRKRIRKCQKMSDTCETRTAKKYSGSECIARTDSPTAAPTTPTMVTCEVLSEKEACLNMTTCEFSGGDCFTLRDEGGNVVCEYVNNYANKKKRKQACPDECAFEPQKFGENKAGYCFSLTKCRDANDFKKANVRKEHCIDESVVDYANTCEWDSKKKMCKPK